MREAVTKLPEGSLPEEPNPYRKLKRKPKGHGPSSAEHHPILSIAMKISLITGALAGCSGTSEAFRPSEHVPPPATAPAAPDTAPPTSNVEVILHPETTTAEIRIGKQDAAQKETLAKETSLTELQNFDLDLLASQTNNQGGETRIFSLNGATPFVSPEEVVAATNNYHEIVKQSPQYNAKLKIDAQNSLDVSFVATPQKAANHYFYFGDSSFLPYRDMPQAFSRVADPAAPGVSYLPQYGPHSEVANSFLADSSATKIVDGTINNAQYGINVEACQNTFNVQVSPETIATIETNTKDSHGNTITQERLQSFGQELVCNSMGLARGYKMTGQTYEKYRAMAEMVHMDLYKPILVDFHVVDQATWDML